MKRSEAAASIAARLAADLFKAEAAQDQSIDRLGKLAQSLTRSRARARLSSTVGQPAFDALARALAAQVEAQRAMVELHEALAEVKERTAFRAVAIGGLDKSEHPVPRRTARLELAA